MPATETVLSRAAATTMALQVDAFRAALKAVEDQPAWMARAERRLERRIARLFREAGAAAVAELLRQEGVPSQASVSRIAAHLDGARPAFLRAVADAADDTTGNGRRTTISAARQAGATFVQTPPAAPPADVIDRVRNRRVEFAASTMDRVTGDVRGNLARSVEEGLGVLEAADALQEVVDGLESWESRRIARTEINGAFGEATFETMRELGVEYHQWLTAEDDRVRGSHVDVHDEIVKVGENFSLGGRYPHDFRLPASESVNCRCRAVPWIPPEGWTPPPGGGPFRE